MVESKIALALTAREIDFVLEYPESGDVDPQPEIPESSAKDYWTEKDGKIYGKEMIDGTSTTKTRFVEGHRVWQTLKGSAKPAGGCPGRVYWRMGR